MRFTIFFVALALFGVLFAQPDAPTLLAKFTSTPSGTQYRTGPNEQWQTAYVNDPLYENYECRNTQSNTYGLAVYSNVVIDFPDGATDVTATSYKGTAEYKDGYGYWYSLPINQEVSALAVRTGNFTNLSLNIKSGRGLVKPREPGGGGDGLD